MLRLVRHHIGQHRASWLGVAVEDILADQALTWLEIDLTRLLVHLYNATLTVTDRDRYVGLFKEWYHVIGTIS